MKKIQWRSAAILSCLLLLITLGLSETAMAQKGKPLILRVASPSGTMGTDPEYLQKAAKEIEKATEGRLKFEFYWSESLVKSKEMLKAIQRGVCDIAWVAALPNPAEIPLWTHFGAILYHPQANDTGYVTRKYWTLFDQSKELRGDYEKWGQTSWFVVSYDAYLVFSKKIVKNLEDMKGMRIRVQGEGPAKMMKAAGGHAVFIPSTEIYTAMEKGIVDGAIAALEFAKRYALHEVAPYAIDTGILLQYAPYNVSLATLKKMSEKDRKTFLQIGRRVSIELGDTKKKEQDNYRKFFQEKGTKILPFPETEKQKWANTPAMKSLIKDWIDQQNAAGRPGTAVMRDFLAAFEVPQWMPAGY